MVQQITLGIGEGFVVLGAQYWGQGRMQPIRKLTGIALKAGSDLWNYYNSDLYVYSASGNFYFYQ